jgi:protoheme IX farnesyltransferase
VLLLAAEVNLLSGFLVLLAAFLYVLVYTPMKRLTWFNTSVGAVPGAIPPMAGWAAATGRLDAGAWILFAILYLWQHAHFYAIAWIYRDDYRAGGFRMLPALDPTGRRTFRLISVHAMLLTAVSVLPAAMGLTGWVYAAGSVAIGAMLCGAGRALARSGSVEDARRLVRASVVYLPVWLILTVADRMF